MAGFLHVGFGNSTRHGMAQTSLPRLIAESTNAMKEMFTLSTPPSQDSEKKSASGLDVRHCIRDGEMRHGWDRTLHSGAILLECISNE